MKLNNTTKKAQHFIKTWEGSPWFQDIWDCYQKPSGAKVRAYYDCLEQETNDRGDGGRIISYNIFGFTYAYKRYDYKNDEMQLVVITKDNEYIIKLCNISGRKQED